MRTVVMSLVAIVVFVSPCHSEEKSVLAWKPGSPDSIVISGQENQFQAQASTPLRELRREHRVTLGPVCWFPLEVRCIDDVCGDANSYWEVSVNGDTRHYNANSKILPADKVEWKFVSSAKR